MKEFKFVSLSIAVVLATATYACSSNNMMAPPDAGVDAPAPIDAAAPIDEGGLPSDPITVAPPLDRSVATSVAAATAFLYTGDHPIQTGVEPATIDPRRVAVLRGHVTLSDGSPLTGAIVSVVGHPELGQTLTRADGAYDLAVNGGGFLVVAVRKEGFLQSERTIDVPWQDYVPVPAMVVMRPDSIATPVALETPGMKVARGSAVTDASGTRRATLIFPPDTRATVATGTSTEILPTLTVHLTEYTVGANGPQAMPGSLPPTSAYTYAVDITVDEANGHTVELTKPALLYVENFLGFAPGTGMPVGAYQPAAGNWSGLPNGIVLTIVSVVGDIAELDTDGDGMADGPAPLMALGITDDERRTLATLYAAGQVVWRSPLPHFSAIDVNRPLTLPGDARPPRLRDPRSPNGDAIDDGCQAGGSIINCHNQSLGEDIPINGTPYFLHYQSDRQPGRRSEYSVDIALSENQLPASVAAIALDVAIAGQTFHQSFPPRPNQHTVFTWDGKDGYHRVVQGRATATISVAYEYVSTYADPVVSGVQFAQFAGSVITVEQTPIPVRRNVTLSQRWMVQLGAFDARPLALGGFTLSPHHSYDFNGRILYTGSGETVRASTLGKTVLDRVLFTTASTGLSDETPIRVANNGGYYILDATNAVVRNQFDDVVAGVSGQIGNCTYAGDGGPATQAPLCDSRGIATGPDGSLYISGDGRIRRVSPDGVIRVIAGVPRGRGPLFQCTPSGGGGHALDAHLCDPREIVAARDGALYFRDKIRTAAAQIFKLSPDGTLSLIAGSSTTGFGGDGGPAALAKLSNDIGLAIDREGNLLVADRGNARVRRIATDGVITTIAGTGAVGDTGDGGLALNATFQQLAGVAAAPDGSVYVADVGALRFRVISAQGVITGFAGDGRLPGSLGGDGQDPFSGLPPTDGSFGLGSFTTVGPDGAVYLGTNTPLKSLFRVVPALPGFSAFEHLIPSQDGAEIYVFDSPGRHLRTLDASNSAILRKFGYDGAGRLITITDVDNKVTTIERNDAGDPTTIVAPFGQRTLLTVSDDGYLTRIIDPAGSIHAFTYGAAGLLATYTDPLNGQHVFTFDDEGRLTSDTDPGESTQTLARTGDAMDSTVTMTTALGRQTSYRIQRLVTGDEVWSNTRSDGTVISVERKPDGATMSTYPDGTTVTMQVGPDPRFGMLSPVSTSLTISTPGGLVQTQTTQRTVSVRDSNDPTSLISANETFVLNGKTFTRFYDGVNKAITITSPLGRNTKATLDDHGRIVNVTNPSVTAMQILYDGSGRPMSVAQGTRQLALTYGADGYVATSTDALTHSITYDRDLLGRIAKKHGPDGSVIELGFDAAGDLLRVRPPGGADHRIDRDILGLARAYVAPDVGPNTSKTTYDYNADLQITSITAPDGATLSLGYDPAGRSQGVTFPDGSIDAAYDAVGRLSTLAAPGGVSLAFGYDGSMPTDVTWSGPISGALHVAFDNDFRIASESLNGEPPVTAHYDDDGLVTSVGALTITRDAPTGRVKQSTIGSVTESYVFNDLGELSNSTAICGTTTLRTVAFTRDAAGVIVGKDETALGQMSSLIYDHDAQSRLTAAHGTEFSSTYTYDDNGNRRTSARPDLVSYSYDAQDRLTQQGNTTYAYNASGQLQTKADPAGTTSYHYDLLGNLRSVDLPDGRSITYVIDGLNRRIGKRVNNAVTQGFLYEGATGVIAELDGTGTIVSRFVYASRSHVPDYLVKGGATYRILTDAVGSPRLVIDVANCQVVQQINYDEFGRILADSNPGFQPFAFAGGLRDPDTGLLRFGARDYDADIGRWTAKDPLGFASGGANFYVYAANNPINLIDPTGLSFAQGLTNFSAGFGDFATFGLTRWIRRKLGVNDVVNPCSALYAVGGVTGVVVTTVATGGLITRLAAARSGTALARELGAAGEAAADIVKNTTRIPSLTGTASYRIPDVLSQEVRLIGEVKNVSSLSYTNQLRDFVAYAQQQGLQFQLIVREATQLSGPLQEAVDAGDIILSRTLP